MRAALSILLLVAGFPVSAPALPWLDVPFVPQVGSGCGSAAIAMIIQYWARESRSVSADAIADTERINRLLPPSSPKGIQGKALKRYLEDHGFDAYIFNGEMQDLEQHLGKGRPVLVCLAPKGVKSPLHYVVVVGLDKESIRFNDPARGKLFREDLSRFQSDWKVTRNWALLAVPRQAQ